MLVNLTSCNRRRGRTALTLLEVTIAVSLLAVLVTGLLAHVSTLQQGRSAASDQVRGQDLAIMLKERLDALPWNDLGSDVAPWSRPRWTDEDAWMGDDPGLGPSSTLPPVPAEQRILQTIPGRDTLGLVDHQTGLDGLRVYLEYYRALSDESGNPGLMDAGYADWRQARNDFALYRITGRVTDVVGGMVVYRVVVQWEPGRSYELMGARREG